MSMENPWQEPCEDMLELIASKISYLDLGSFAAVCSSWHRAAKTYRRFSRAILLSIAKNQRDGCVADGSSRLSFCLRTMSEGKVSSDATNVVVSLSDRYHQFFCVGWSKEMLVLADMETQTEIVVIDRFYRRSFCLPPLTPRTFWTSYPPDIGLCEVEIVKAVVLLTSEKKSGDELSIVLSAYFIYSRACLVCYRGGSWALLDSKLFVDIVARERQLFALDFSNNVYVWDFNRSNSDPPTKVMRFKPSEDLRRMCNCFSKYSHYYLVKSIGEEFLLVERYMERDMGIFATSRFQVYKSRLRSGEKWVEVDSLGDDTALFLGWNESVSVSIRDLPKGYEGNSIYFTANFFGSLYRSHEIGVYNLKHKKINIFHSLDEDLDGPTLVWMV